MTALCFNSGLTQTIRYKNKSRTMQHINNSKTKTLGDFKLGLIIIITIIIIIKFV